MASRFTRPETRVLTISNGDTLTVKKRLSAGERRAMFARMYVPGPTGALLLNPLQQGLAEATAFLLDWSLTDDAGNQVVIRELDVSALEQVLNGLNPDDFGEIVDAIEAHEAEMRKEIADQKKAAGETTSSATSPSPDASAGDTSGSGT